MRRAKLAACFTACSLPIIACAPSAPAPSVAIASVTPTTTTLTVPTTTVRPPVTTTTTEPVVEPSPEVVEEPYVAPEPVYEEPTYAEPAYEPATEDAEGNCGGSLPPCWVMEQESGGDPTAVNPSGCGGRGCGGKWQADPVTWDGYGGYARAEDAPESVQDDFARELFNNGAGCGHWDAC